MDSTLAALTVAGVTLLFNVSLHLFGGGWKLSRRLSSFESSISGMQDEIKKLSNVLINMSDMRGDLKVLYTRVTAVEQDIREIRHGDGFIRGPHGIDREYDK